MKVSSLFKYIFIIFAIGIIIFAGYKIYKNQQNRASQETQGVANEEENIIKDIRLAVTSYDTINPLVTNNQEILNIDTLIYDPLFKLNEKYELIPCIATECSKTGDNTYVIKIDNTIKWSDGLSVEADDVKFTIETIQKGNSVYKYNVQYISGMEVIDNGTLKITLSANIPFFQYYLIFPILSSKQYEGEDFYASDKTPIGSGRYQIANISTNSITLTSNPKWKNKDNEDVKIENHKYTDFLIILTHSENYSEDEIRNFDGIVLTFSKNNVLFKEQNGTSIITQSYEELNKTIDISQINKEYLVNMAKGENAYTILANIFAVIFISTFLTYLLTAILDTIALSLLGFIVSRLIRVPFKYGALYSLSISAITLPVILNCIYMVVNMFTGFVIPYFQIMYTLISYVYLIAALLIMRSEIMKKKVQIRVQIMNKNYNPEELQNREKKKEEEKEESNKEEKEDQKESKDSKKKGAGLKNNKDNPEPQANIQNK